MLLSSNEINHRYSVGRCKEFIYIVRKIPTSVEGELGAEIQIHI